MGYKIRILSGEIMDILKEGTEVLVHPVYAYGCILVNDKNGTHGIIKGWSDHFERYAVLMDGWKDYVMIRPEDLSVLGT